MNIQDYWIKQGVTPAFPDLLWSKPENKQHAGKLLIIGGHAHGFAAPAEAYNEALKAGIGTARVILPDHIRTQLKPFARSMPEMEFAPSTPSGSFASRSLAELLDASAWADGVLLAGDLGRNSETAIVLEKLMTKTNLPLVLTKDAVDYFTSNTDPVLSRGKTCIVLSLAQLQKLVQHTPFETAITFSMDLVHLVEALHNFTAMHNSYIITKHHDNVIVAVNGGVSTTKTNLGLEDNWRVATASMASVWLIQNPTKPFEALTTAVYTAQQQ